MLLFFGGSGPTASTANVSEAIASSNAIATSKITANHGVIDTQAVRDTVTSQKSGAPTRCNEILSISDSIAVSVISANPIGSTPAGPYVVPQPIVVAQPATRPPNIATGVQIGTVEIWLPVGGHFEFLPGGDLMLARDDDGSYSATEQRLGRLVNSTPTILDTNGNPIGKPTDLKYPNWGSGMTAMIGEPENVAIPFAQRATLASLAGDPGLAPNGQPTVTISDDVTPGALDVAIKVQVVDGNTVTFPSVAGA